MNIGHNIEGIKWFFPKNYGIIRHYENLRERAKFMFGRELPEWVDLSPKQREIIIKETKFYWKGLAGLGQEIRNEQVSVRNSVE